MGLRFWMKYVACGAQPDAGKTLKIQGTLLPPLGNDGPDDDPPGGTLLENPPEGIVLMGQPD